eukprot:GSChrysophyteH2.ASY1.ANO1.1134.1 assembled CDS
MMKLHHFVLFGAVYIVYHVTLLPSVPGGDSGELLGNSCVFGISHPPGYPLFSLLSYMAGKLTFVPRMYLQGFTSESSVSIPSNNNNNSNNESGYYQLVVDHSPTYAWKVNHMDSVPPSAVFGAVLFAFSPLAWEYASQSAEVFALNNFICACTLMFTCKQSIGARMLWTIYCGAFFSGLAFANQHASLIFLVVLIPAVIFLAWPVMMTQGRLTSLFAGSFAAFLAGVSPYVLQVYLARVYPAKGSWGNLDDWRGIFTHIFRAEYGTFKLGIDRAETEGFVERIWLYFQHTSSETFHSVFPLLALSVAVGNYSFSGPGGGGRLLYNIFLGTWLFYILVWHGVLSNLPLNSPMPFIVHARFWIQPHIILCTLAGVGAAFVCKFVRTSITSTFSETAEYALLVICFAMIVKDRYAIMDRSKSGW